MLVIVAVAAAAGALWLAVPPVADQRLASALRPYDAAAGANGESSPGDQRHRRVSPAVLAGATGGVAAAVLIGGATGVIAGGLVFAVTVAAIGRLEPARLRRRRESMEQSLPLCADLMAACLSAGRPPSYALREVAQALGGPLGEELTVLAARLALGADPVEVWRAVARERTLGPLGRSLARAMESGAPLTDALHRLAADLRRRQRASAQRRARAVGVRAAAPLGLCFLPAFVLIGIVPAAVSAFASFRVW